MSDSIDVHGLPALPKPCDKIDCVGVWNGEARTGTWDAYNADQMRDYARVAVEAALRQSGESVPALPSDEINALPEHVRKYIMWLETDADPAGTIRENFRLTEENAALRVLIQEGTEQVRQSGEAVATIHRDGYWTHEPGRDPFDRFGPNANSSGLKVYTAPPATSGLVDDYKEIARLIGSIFFYGGFKAETYNERKLEKLLRKVGCFYETEQAALAALAAHDARIGK